MNEKEDILRRTKVAAGHLEGIERMIEREDYCVDIIRQIQAVQASLTRLSGMVLESHLQTCVAPAVRGDDPEAREKVLGEIARIFETANKS